MSTAEAPPTDTRPRRGSGLVRVARMLVADPVALIAFFFLVFIPMKFSF